LVVLLSLVVLRAATAHGQDTPPAWQPLGGPPGRISHLAARADGSALYAVSVALTYRQDDQTQWQAAGKAARSDAIYWSHAERSDANWQPLTNNLPPAPITALYADPNAERLLWAGLAGELWAGARWHPFDKLRAGPFDRLRTPPEPPDDPAHHARGRWPRSVRRGSRGRHDHDRPDLRQLHLPQPRRWPHLDRRRATHRRSGRHARRPDPRAR
jgi:hypothetical protein